MTDEEKARLKVMSHYALVAIEALTLAGWPDEAEHIRRRLERRVAQVERPSLEELSRLGEPT